MLFPFVVLSKRWRLPRCISMTWNIDLFVGIILSMKYSVFCLFLLSVIYSAFLEDCSSETEALALFEQSWSDDTPLDTDVIATVLLSLWI